MKKAWLILAVAVFVFVQMGSLGIASDDKYARSTLKGFTGVNVIVRYLDPDIEKDGLTMLQITTDVELKLRLAGIKVLALTEMRKKALHTLVIDLGILKTKSFKGYVYRIDVSLEQFVYLKRNSSVPINFSTWSTGTLGITTDISDIRNAVENQVDIFINAYLSVNPK